MQASGILLRIWSMRTLGSYYTRTLRTSRHQHVIDSGPYRMIRHPGYTGALLIWIGLALTTRNAPTIAVLATLMGRSYLRRITVEEALLQRALPEYSHYSDRTKKLIPLIW
ncbi:methyltransferase family protein [Mycobacteroides abscessus]